MARNNQHRWRRPDHWIGIASGWEDAPGVPWDQLVSLPPAHMRTHVHVLGKTGSGKTTLLHHLMAQDVLLGHAFAVLDMRGDLVEAAKEICADRVDPRRLCLIDLREKARPTGFNPLYGSGEPYFRALNVLDVVASEHESWGVQLAETLRNALMLLAEVGEPLTRLESLFYDRNFLFRCLERSASDPVAAFWRRFDELSRDRKAAMTTPVVNKVSLLLSTETLRRVLGHPRPVDLGAHLNVPGSVTLVSLAADETHAAGRMLGRMALASVCREVFSRVDVPESRRVPIRLYVDEFENFGPGEFEPILAEGRRFGLSLVIAHQTLAQLTPRMRAMVLGNVGTKVVFRCGREDGAAMSRDLVGDPKAYDFPGLPVGRAVVSNAWLGCVEVEINAPIVRDVGVQSVAARRLASAALDHAEASVGSRPGVDGDRAGDCPIRRSPQEGSPTPTARDDDPPPTRDDEAAASGPDVEDWLCD